jgi:hypothetical protein
MRLRIVRTRYKLLYFVVWLAVTYVFSRYIYPHWSEIPRLVSAQVLSTGFTVLAIRSFRGRSEPVAPPRPWWRMTGGVVSGFLLGGLWLVSIPLLILVQLGVWPTPTVAEPPVEFGVNTAINAVLAALFIHSAIRLRRALPDDPKLREAMIRTAPPVKGLG